MQVTKFTEFLALFVDLRVRVSGYASETDVWLFFLPMISKTSINSFIHHITTFSKHHLEFYAVLMEQK